MRPLLLLILLACLALPGCRRPDSLNQAVATAVSTTGGRVPAAAFMTAEWKAGNLKIDEAIDLAFEQLDSVKNNIAMRSTNTIPKSIDATTFAGAVLDAVNALGPQLPLDAEHEIFWQRVGGLAFAASEEAFAAASSRLAEARTLVFAGGLRWQSEAYWHLHSAHDSLASVILARSGERTEAISRLQNRADLNGPAEEVLGMLKKGQ